jgi:hypothetical protein
MSKQDTRTKTGGKQAALPATFFHAGILLGLFFDLEMEAIGSSETSVDFQRTERRYILEDSTFHNQRSENLKSCIGTIQFAVQ